MRSSSDFRSAIYQAEETLLNTALPVHSKFWQGTDITKMPAAEMRECLNYSLQVPLRQYRDLVHLQDEIEPNLPWADVHFTEERVGGQPLNPGDTWKIWPWSNAADKHRKEGEQFNHTYAERFWPRHAGQTPGGKIRGYEEMIAESFSPREGIRHRYADLNDVVNMLVEDPLTRQAYIPMWFPEDGSHSDRKPCTLGYHVIMRNGFLHMNYYIRSCDIFRHFRDDIYLAVRLLFWLLDEIRADRPDPWMSVKPGLFTMHITSLHCFVNDFRVLEKRHGRT